MLLCSHSPNDAPPPPEPQRSVSITAVRGLVRPTKAHKNTYNYFLWGPEIFNVEIKNYYIYLILTQVIIV